MNKGKRIKVILPLLLLLTLLTDTVCASEVPVSESILKEEETEKKIRTIEVEEEVTKACGEIFSLDVKLTDCTDGESKTVVKEELKEEIQKEEEIREEDVLQYESDDPEIVFIEEDESGRVLIKAVGTGDTIITITAPETKEYEKTETQVKLYVSEAGDESLKEPEEYSKISDPEELEEVKDPEQPKEAEEVEDPEQPDEPEQPEEVEELEQPEEPEQPEKVEELPDTNEEILIDTMSIRSASKLTAVENVENGVSLQWKKVKGAKGYYLERSTNGKSPWKRVKTSADADDVTFTDTQVVKGGTYYYRVKVFDDLRKKGLTGASKKIVHLAAPALQTGLLSAGIELKWNRVAGCSGYCVYRREPEKSEWTVAANITQPGEIVWRDVKAGNGKAYVYSVRAYKGRSLSPYAKAKSYVRVTVPSVKSFKRKSPTAYKLTWKKNTAATGYQIQYAKNGMFVGAKKATVKNAKTSDYTLKKLEKNKNYYARIRAYKKSGGKTYYSGWSAAGNVKKTRTTKATPLKKNKKIFEIRTWAKQKMYQYDTLQGSCTDGTYAYYLMYNRRAVNCKVVKVKRSNLKVVKVSGVLNVAHGNDMTYDKHKKRLVIVHSTGIDPKRLTSVNPKTLKVIGSKHVQIPRKLAGGSKADAARATAFNGIAYSSGRKQYAVLLSHTYNFVVLDPDLNPVRYIKVSKKNNYLPQGIDATDDYIMLAQSPKSSKQKYNIITVYDWDGNYISKINVKKGCEIESIYHVGSKYYAGFYRSYYKTYTKNVIKKVKVDGKEEEKKVKVKYKELQRDNHVYQISGI